MPAAVGTPVLVRNRYLGAWSRGFQVAEHVPGGYRIRRLSDGSVFPDVFSVEDVKH
ncbi:MAG: hypothetical protein ACYDA2_01240 [Acidimicrobiales bacterium]